MYIYIVCIYIYPPTPAFAKAGAAPGTTAGVDLVFLSNRHPKATSMASYGRPAFSRRSSVPFARHSQPTGIPRPHQWLLMGVQACRLPAPKPLKRLKPSKRSKPLKLSKPLKPFLWASSAGIATRFAANRHPKATSMASYGRPSLPFASPPSNA